MADKPEKPSRPGHAGRRRHGWHGRHGRHGLLEPCVLEGRRARAPAACRGSVAVALGRSWRACDDACGGTTSATADATTTGATTDTAGVGAVTTVAGGAPGANPCADGGNGTFIPPTEPAPGATAVEVTADDFTFGGIDALAVGGELAVTLTNVGDELHEIVVQRIDDDETRTIAELLQSEDDPATFATGVGSAFACPGASSVPNRVTVTEPGRYAALCFIPSGLTAATTPAEFETLGPPHAFQGMVAEFRGRGLTACGSTAPTARGRRGSTARRSATPSTRRPARRSSSSSTSSPSDPTCGSSSCGARARRSAPAPTSATGRPMPPTTWPDRRHAAGGWQRLLDALEALPAGHRGRPPRPRHRRRRPAGRRLRPAGGGRRRVGHDPRGRPRHPADVGRRAPPGARGRPADGPRPRAHRPPPRRRRCAGMRLRPAGRAGGGPRRRRRRDRGRAPGPAAGRPGRGPRQPGRRRPRLARASPGRGPTPTCWPGRCGGRAPS